MVDTTCCGEELTRVNSVKRNKRETFVAYECKRCGTPWALRTQLFITISERQHVQRQANVIAARTKAQRRLQVVS